MSARPLRIDPSDARVGRVILTALATLLMLAPPASAAREQQEKRVDLSCGENCELRLSTNRLLEFRHDEPDIRLRIGGRVHADGAWIGEDVTPMPSDVKLRRGRIEVRGRVFDDFKFKVAYDFAPGREGWRNLWGRYSPVDSLWIKGGNFVAPFGYEDRSSSNHTEFLERSLASAIAPGYQTGAGVGYAGKIGRSEQRNRITFELMGGAAPLGQGLDDKHRSDHWGLATRATWAPIARRRRVAHLGASVGYQNVADGSIYRVGSRPESSIATTLVSTGNLPDVDHVVSVGVEAIGLYKSFSMRAEYLSSMLLRRNAQPRVDLWGAYGQVAWIVTGEHRRYSRTGGRIKGPIPKRILGAVELAARVSYLDLTDEDVVGGRETNVTAGVNWYLRQNVRLMVNYVWVDARLRGSLQTDRPHIVQGRFALFF